MATIKLDTKHLLGYVDPGAENGASKLSGAKVGEPVKRPGAKVGSQVKRPGAKVGGTVKRLGAKVGITTKKPTG
jgi:hypothetical protein